jgi:hypothetical protein
MVVNNNELPFKSHKYAGWPNGLDRSYCKEAGIMLKFVPLLLGILLIAHGFSLGEESTGLILKSIGAGCIGVFSGILSHELRKR